MTHAKAVRRAMGISFLLSVVNCVYAQGQQANTYSSPTIGSTPLGLSPGAPAGSYALSGFDSVNLFNGNLNFRLPLLQIGGRGSAGYTMMLKIEQKWRVESATFLPPPGPGGEQPPETTNHIPVGYWWAGLEPGYGPGVLQGRHSGDGSLTCAGFPATQRFFDQTLTRITFTTPDGTEYDFRDELTGGTPHNLAIGEQCSLLPFSRGRVWITDDGSAASFISDTEIRDQYADPTVYPGDLIPPNSAGALFYPSGWLFMRDGTRYRIVGGVVSWIADRNGNQINFSGGTLPSPITDSLDREVTIIYADFNANPPRMYDEIKFKGFDQTAHFTDRSIKIFFANLGSVLRSGTTQSTIQLFGNTLDGSDTAFNPTVVSSVALPDGRQYQFRYNAFGELARVMLPTGGAIEYDYDGGVGAANNSGLLISPNFEIYRRLVERRVYPDGGTGLGFESKTTYSRPEGAVPNDSFVLMQTRDSSNNLLDSQKHYFFGTASPTIFRFANDYSNWSDGKEYQTRFYDTNGTMQLRQIDHTWEQGALLSQQPGPTNAAQNPRIKETLTTLSDTSQVAKQAFGYDVYNNVTDTCDYDLGSGTFGSLLRHSHTDYLKTHPVSLVDYANSTFDLVQPKRNIHLRNLPLTQIINTNCSDTLNQAAKTDYEYDNYTPDSNHAALTARSDISSQYSFFDTSWTTRGNVTGVTRWLNMPASSITSYQQYDIAGNVTKAIDPLGHATTIDYTDNFGNPDGSTDERFNPTELGSQKTYAFATSVTNALGQTSYTQFNYYVAKPVDAKDLNGTVTSAYYQDVLDRPSKLIHAANESQVRSQTSFSYDDSLPARTITTISDQNSFSGGGLRSDALYDGLGRTIETRQYETATGYITAKQTYDPMGRARQVSNPYRSGDTVYWTTTDYDGLGRVKTITTSDLAVVTTTYSGNQTTVRDQANKQRRSITDGLGRLTNVDEMLEYPSATVYATTIYGYDALDNLTSVAQTQQTPSVTQNRTFVYNSLKRLTDATNPESGHIHYTYYDNGNLQTKTDARTPAVITTYFYDAVNRIIKRTYSDSATPEVDYYYDNQTLPPGAPNFTRGASIGRLVGVCYGGPTSNAGSYQGYDAMGHSNVSAQKTDSQSYVFSNYSYNLASEMTSQTYPSGRAITTAFDITGRVTTVSGQKTDEAKKTYASQFSYAPHGGISAMRLGNTKWEHTLFNNRLQPYEIGLGVNSSDSGTLKLEYTYSNSDPTIHDNNGNVLSQKITAPKNPSGNLILTQTYSYDTLNRLLTSSENGSPSWRQTYDYDRYGNRAVRKTSYIPPANIGLTPQSANSTDFSAFTQSTNRLNQTTYPNVLYDGAGNLTRDQAASAFVYDGENRQTSYNNGAVTYTYDGDGRRVKKVVAGSPTVTTIFVYNVVGQLIAEYTSDPVPSPPGGGGTSYLTSDHLGSTRVVTKADGSVKARYDYLPFGEEILSDRGGRANVTGYSAADSTKQKFTQKERDNESGLDYFGARYYSAAQGRFTSPDLPFAGQEDINPQTWNLYTYTSNNPLNLTDPDGRRWFYRQDDGKVTGVQWVNPNDDGSYTSPGEGWIGFIPTQANPVLEVTSADGRIAYHFWETPGGAPVARSYWTGKTEDATVGLVMDYFVGKGIGTIVGRAVSSFASFALRGGAGTAAENIAGITAKQAAKLRELLERIPGAKNVFAFGSRTTGKSTANSDLDIALIGQVNSVDPATLRAVREAQAYAESIGIGTGKGRTPLDINVYRSVGELKDAFRANPGFDAARGVPKLVPLQ